MIQRKQTLFLLLSVICSLALGFVNCNILDVRGSKIGASIFVIPNGEVQPGIWYFAGIAINIISALVALIAIFIYKKRDLQVKLCYLLIILHLAITAIVSFCPVVKLDEGISYKNAPLAGLIGLIAIFSVFMAGRFVKKDIELLKSADRIR